MAIAHDKTLEDIVDVFREGEWMERGGMEGDVEKVGYGMSDV